LFTAGSLFPDLEDSGRWKEKGRRLLEQLVREQVYDDGSYLQHSFNYQRFTVSMLLWAIYVDDLTGRQLGGELRDRTLKCAQMLSSFVDADTGAAPNTGGNDGAYLFALGSCDYADFRPVVQWAFRQLAGIRIYSPGPWDETADWFGAPAGDTKAIDTRSAPIGGYDRLQGNNSWGMLRCAQYKDRPFHADQLHLDIFYRGKPFILDPGTYAYNPQTGDHWDNALTGTAVHNTVSVDGRDQMLRAGRFLWLDWAQGKVHRFDASSIDAEHNGYAPVIHRRSVRVEGDRWIVTDDITGPGEGEIELHWLTADNEWRMDGNALNLGNCSLRVDSSANQSLRLIRSGERMAGTGCASIDQYRGWYSPTYRVKQPAISLISKVRATLPVRFTTEISFSE
jgi:hypothetical protein